MVFLDFLVGTVSYLLNSFACKRNYILHFSDILHISNLECFNLVKSCMSFTLFWFTSKKTVPHTCFAQI